MRLLSSKSGAAAPLPNRKNRPWSTECQRSWLPRAEQVWFWRWKEWPRSYQPGLAGKERTMGLIKGKAIGTANMAEPEEQLNCEELAVELEDSDATVRR